MGQGDASRHPEPTAWNTVDVELVAKGAAPSTTPFGGVGVRDGLRRRAVPGLRRVGDSPPGPVRFLRGPGSRAASSGPQHAPRDVGGCGTTAVSTAGGGAFVRRGGGDPSPVGDRVRAVAQ